METKQSSSYKWIILGLLWLGIFVGSYAQFQLPAIAREVIQKYHLSSSQFASLVSAPMWMAIFFSIFAGALSDKFGVKRIVTIGFIISSIGLFMRIYADNYTAFYVSMVALGAAPTFLNPNRAKVLGTWFGREKLSMVMGISLTTGGLATSIATGTTAFFQTTESAFTFAFILCLSIGILWVAFMKDKPNDAVEEKIITEQDKNNKSIWSYLAIAVKNRNVWKIGLALLMVMTFMSTILIFLPKILNEARGFDAIKAGIYSASIPLGSLAGGLLSPLIYMKVGRYKPCLIAYAVIGAALAFISWQAPEGTLMIITTFLTGFCMGAPMPLLMSYPMLLPEIGRENAASASGLAATIQLLGPVLVVPYVITPIAGNNTYLLIGLASFAMLLMGTISFLLPELGKKVNTKSA
jgi:NNP family nitrate/nitrite transporter-like MFS transporter